MHLDCVDVACLFIIDKNAGLFLSHFSADEVMEVSTFFFALSAQIPANCMFLSWK